MLISGAKGMRTPYISLRWSLVIVAAVVSLLSGYMYYRYTSEILRDVFVEGLLDRQIADSAVLNGTFREWEEKVITSMEAVGMLLESESLIVAKDPGSVKNVVEHSMNALFSTGISHLALFDATGQLINETGIQTGPNAATQLVSQATQTKTPRSALTCRDKRDCTHFVAIPILSGNQETRAVLLAAFSFTEVTVSFTGITGQQIQIMDRADAVRRTTDDAFVGNQSTIPVVLTPNISGFPEDKLALVTTFNATSIRQKLYEVTQRSAIFAVSMCALLLLLVTPTITISMRRLKSTVESFEPLTRGELMARDPPRNRRLWHDEIDKLHDVLTDTGTQITTLTTGLRESHEILREQLAYSEDLMESVAVPILCLDSQGRVADFNVAFAQFFGATRADVLNRSLDILAVEPTAFGALLRAASWIRPQAFGTPREASFIRPAGSTCQCLVAGGPYMRPDGSIIGSIFTFVDLTLLRRTEERFSAIARQLPGALFQFSLVGGRWTILFASDGLEIFTGLPSSAFYEDFAVFLGHVHPDDRVAFTESVRQAVTLTENWSFGFRIMHTDGSIRWVRGSGAAPALPVSNPVWTGILLNVTPEHLAHVAAHDAIASQAAAETAVAAKDGHIRMISHEIRNTLQSVLGYAAILKRGAFTTNSQPTTADLTALQYAANDLFEIVNDLLTLQRCASGAQEPMKPIRVGEFVNRIEQHVKPWLRTNSLHVELSAALRDIDIITDGHLLRRAVTNLLSNACKYTAHGQIHLTVSAREHRHFVIEVRDTGCGIAPDELSRLGQPFQQATRVRDRRSLGTGLGLVLVEQFVGFLNGSLQVASEIGVGTAVTITVPFVKVDAPGLENPTTTSRADEDVSLRSVSVLVIDDDPVIRDVVSRLLRPHVAAVDQAHCGLHGLQRLSETRYNLVVTDLGLPDISGLDMVRTYRAENPKAATAFILLTGNADAGRCAGTSLANAACLLKPVDEDVLVGTAKRLLALPTNTVDPTIEQPHPMRRSFAANALTPAVVLDSPRLLGAFKGDTTAAVSHMHAFIVDTLRQIDLAVQLSAAASNSAVLSIAHRLAGTCATIGADRLAQMAEELIQHMPVWTTQERRRIFRALYSEVALLEQEFRTIVSDPNPLLTETVCP